MIKTVWLFPACPAHFTSITWIARVMPVHVVVMGHAVLQTLGSKPPRLTVHDSLVGAIVVTLLSCVIARQGTVSSVSTQEAVSAIWRTISVRAHFIAVDVACVMASFVIVLRNTEYRAVLAMPAVSASLTSVMRTAVMPVDIVVVRNAVHIAFGTIPPR